ILTAHSEQQLAVLDPAPAATGDGVFGMTGKLRRKAYGQMLVKQQAHRPRGFRTRGRVMRWPAPVAPTEVGAETRRACRPLPGSRTSTEPALVCRGRPLAHPRYRDP